MRLLHPHANTLAIAKESLAMSEKTGDKTFQRMALGLMALTGVGTLLHAVHEICRDMQPKGEKAKPVQAARPFEPEAGPRKNSRDEGPGRNWVQKARVSDRPAEGKRAWTDSLTHQDRGRHR